MPFISPVKQAFSASLKNVSTESLRKKGNNKLITMTCGLT